jgi:hypothetical protein
MSGDRCGDDPGLRCPRHVAEPCTLFAGHPGQLHEHHHPTHPADWPPVRRWWRCEDGTVVDALYGSLKVRRTA